MRRPRQGVPIAVVIRCRSPLNCFPRQSCLDMRVFRDVVWVVKINEAAVESWKVHGNNAEN